jgi:hypothetical protein
LTKWRLTKLPGWEALRKRAITLKQTKAKLNQSTANLLEKTKDDPVAFGRRFLGFQALPYQERVLTDKSKRIAVRMSRQAGKTTTIAVRGIWFAATHPRTLSLIVAPSLRQSNLD